MWTRIALELTTGAAAEVAVRIIVNSGLICSALLTLSLVLLPRNLADWCLAILVVLSCGLIFALLINGDMGKKVLEAAPLFGSMESKAFALIIAGLIPESNTKHQTIGFLAGACFQLAGSILLMKNYGPMYLKNMGSTLDDEIGTTGTWAGENLARAVNSPGEAHHYANLGISGTAVRNDGTFGQFDGNTAC